MNSRLVVIAFVSLLVCGSAFAGPKEELAAYRTAVQTGIAAYDKGDYAAAETAFVEALKHAPQRGAAHYALARAQARLAKTAPMFDNLRLAASMAYAADLDGEAAFAPYRKLPDYEAAKTQFARATEPVCACSTVYEGSADTFLAEGIAFDALRHRLFVGSVRTRRIVSVANGKQTDFATLPGGYAPFGMAIEGKSGTLWIAASKLPQTTGTPADQLYGSALIALDVKTGAVRHVYPAPAGAKHAFGDLAIAHDGTIYVTDSIEGSLYRLRPGAPALEMVGTAGMFASPQGIVVKPDGKVAVVADYAMGILLLNLETGEMAPAVGVKDDISTLGTDGLVLLQGGRFPAFAATQNGVSAPRIIRFTMYPLWNGVDGWPLVDGSGPPVADVSLAAPDGKGGYYFVAVSQWKAFDEDKSDPVRPVPRWKIMHYPN